MLTANSLGIVKGKFKIPAKIPAGSKLVTFDGEGGTHGEAVFTGSGQVTVQTLRQANAITSWYYDPLAQTFTLPRNMALGGIDLFFTAAGGDVRVQIRAVSGGVPVRSRMAEAFVPRGEIKTTGPTRVAFDSPVNLLAQTEYAVVVLCDDAETGLAVAEVGKFDAAAQTWVSAQPYQVGVLLSSSNAATWTAHQERDLAFVLLEAVFDMTATAELDLGTATVAGATDMILEALAEIPAAAARVEYELTMPDGSTVTVAEGQPVIFGAPVTGQVGVKARLFGDSTSSPVLYPGAQLVCGHAAATGDYVSTRTVASGARKVVVMYEAQLPSGASVSPKLKLDNGSFDAMDQEGTKVLGAGWVEYRYVKAISGKSTAQLKLDMAGTALARPVVRNVRMMAQK